MKRKWKVWKLLAAGLAAMLLFTACGSGGGGYDNASVSSSASMETGEAAMGTMAANGLETGGIDADIIEDTERKIVYTASVAIETETFDDAASEIRSLVDEAGGYIASSNREGGSDGSLRWASYSCRIPAGNYASFLESLSGAGNVYRVDQSTDDVTTRYVDVEARISSLETQRDRLTELAAGAADIETLLAIETQLSDVQYQLESYTAQMRVLQNQVDYSTVDISLNEVRTVSEGTGFGTRVKAAFGGSWESFVGFLQGLIIALIYLLPGLIVLGVILAVVIPLLVRHSRKEKARAASQFPGQFSGWNQPSPPAPETKPEPPEEEQKKG